MNNLTEKQSEVMYIIVNNPRSSIREIAGMIGIKPLPLFDRIRLIKKKGFVLNKDRLSRTLSPTCKPTGLFFSFENSDIGPNPIQVFSRKCKK